MLPAAAWIRGLMRYLALACDYDGTLAKDGRVDEPTVAALKRLLASGRKLILATGRELDDLRSTFANLELFEYVVAENGALLYRPGTREEKPLASAPPQAFVAALRVRGVTPLSVGRAIVATWRPHETVVLKTIGQMGLGLTVTFNKDAVMVLPAGITKGTGLAAALQELGLSPHNVAAIGDAENDFPLLSLCECAAAVANALPAVKRQADIVTRGDHGAGVRELIDELLANDLRAREERLTRHHLLLGASESGDEIRLPPYGIKLLIAGPSGSGKSTVTTTLLERLEEQKYQFCILDPEGDYEGLKGPIVLGNRERAPGIDEALQLLEKEEDLVINLIGLPLGDRPPFFASLLPRVLELRARIGRPHWLVIDEAHHLLPATWIPGTLSLPQDLERLVLITVHPTHVSPVILPTVNAMIVVGDGPEKTFQDFFEASKKTLPALAVPLQLQPGEVFLWWESKYATPLRLRIIPGRMEHRRHTRKYAVGEIPPERSFYFRGPEGKLNLRAQNLVLFLQLAEGVDDATWLHHLRQADYSRWFRETIADKILAEEAARVEQQTDLSPAESRARIRAAVERYYTLPASPPLPMPGTAADPDRA